jgi:putative pyruvate formate lyase activating enzyme
MPGEIAGTQQILQFLADEVSPDTYINVMDQYRPAGRVTADKFAAINRPTARHEYEQAVQIAGEVGLYRLDIRKPNPRFVLRAFD